MRKLKQKKYEIRTLEEGYEDSEEAMLQEAKRRLEEANKPFNPLDIINMKNIIILFIWGVLYRLFIYLNFGAVYFMFSIVFFIFYSLDYNKTQKGLSAYSIFNPNQERILGTMTMDNFHPGLGRNRSENEGEFENNENFGQFENEFIDRPPTQYDTKAEIKKRKMKENAKQSLNSICECGSGKKYKNCCLKKEQ